MSTARIQFWHEKEQWLYYAPFFQSERWDLRAHKGFKKYLNKSIKVHKDIKPNYESLISFENSLNNMILDKREICEVIRLTTCGASHKQLFILYLAQKKLTQLLARRNMSVAFIITEQAMEVSFYQSLGKDIFLLVGQCDLKDTGNITYKGISIIKKLDIQFSKLTYSDYKKKCFSQKDSEAIS
ncbi:acyl-homoserine-lactone synthase [Vibrio mangrovi]|uniref:acyl-homoserine-lactone synthase n=1 Tax=Vibrio mangrovi TaxID=474394 RepID=A0ABU4ICZ2_9VIBR|nr:acyl-homoserine-lactone synthase [Vibrio mangrovi]MDW6004838.1 acyl-homoserine-lactone synthase [Vibrio mangrovi]